MPSALPEGEPVPRDGSLPASSYAGLGTRPMGVYLHVPFCAVRCGYCDFNTYTATELGGGASQASYAATAVAEVRLARRVLGDADVPAATVFLGGGTPTLLPPRDLAQLLAAVRDELGLLPGAEVTTEANPDSVDEASLAALREAGFTRVSFGMQSAVPHVLATLDRTHDPDRVPQAVGWARAAGFEGVSLDLIYGTPGESQDDWRASLEAAIGYAPDHISAYALVVEEGTRMAAQVRRGEIAGAGRRRPRRPLPARRRAARRRRVRLVRGEQLGPRRVAAGPAQRGLLARPRLVGRRPGRAQPRRRHPVVERAAPDGVRRSAGRRRQPGARPRGAHRRAAPGRAGAARHPAARGPPARRPAPGRPAGGRPRGRRTGCWTRPRTPTAAQR